MTDADYAAALRRLRGYRSLLAGLTDEERAIALADDGPEVAGAPGGYDEEQGDE